MVTKLHEQCFQTARKFESPAWADTDDGYIRPWFGNVECDKNRILYERWVEAHPLKHRPYMAALQIGCNLLQLPMVILSPSFLTAGASCAHLDGTDEGETPPAY